ncbi:MAG: radical SAM protein [Myxococcales bacterium]|nr:radical SAM protein [Myxococcales bacterium]
MRRLRVALVLPYGDAREGYFPDTLMELATTEARRAGHAAALVRVYYDPTRPTLARESLASWLRDKSPDLVVVERLFDPAPIVDFTRERAGSQSLMVSWGDADLVPGIDLCLGLFAGTTPSGRTRRSPGAGDLVWSFGELLRALATNADPLTVPGVMRNLAGRVEHGPPLERRPLPAPFEPALDAETLCTGTPPRITHRVVFGNSGCPFALDPLDNPHYRGLPLAQDAGLSRLGCAFCHAGGDYQARPDDEVIAELVTQARYFWERTDVRTFVISDQHPVRYLESLIVRATEAGLGGARWLFPARADAFVRELDKLERAVLEAEQSGQVLELYLSGFEAFSDEELRRYNKGATVSELVRAVESMRRLHAEHPAAFDYARTKGHSLVLWNPWTRVENVAESVANIREFGLGELFDELGHNRLRLYPDLPIAHAAARDGAVVEDWDPGDEGAAQKKGYSKEQPWRFLDPRTRLGWELSQRLRARLGSETEVAQLAAALDFAKARAYEPGLVAETLSGVERLDRELVRLAGPEHPRSTRERAPELAASVVLFGGACNDGCAHCPNRDSFLDDALVFERVAAARATEHPIVLAGREPTLFSAIDRAIEAASGDDGRAVGLVTNGRRLSHAPFTARLVKAGLRFASVKLFGPDAESADAISQDPGGFAQATAGVQRARELGVELELRVRLDARILDRLEELAAVAGSLGVLRLRVEPALDAVGLDGLDAAAAALVRLERACRAADLSLRAAPLSAGARRFDRMVST